MNDTAEKILQGDEDMKIAPSSRVSTTDEDTDDAAARQFLRQKDSGNIDKARLLGKEYAAVLLDNQSLLSKLVQNNDEIYEMLLLYSYVVNRVIADRSPNSILAQTTLNVFYNTLETSSPEIYEHINDMAAFSLYILCERSGGELPEKIGATYAGLLHRAGELDVVRRGISLYNTFYEMCADKYREIGYVEV